MAGRSDIEAGKAYVTLYAKNSPLIKALDASSAKLQSWGAGIAKIGAGIAAIGGSIVGVFTGAIAHFSTAGSELADMSARTGVAAERLAELKYAAEQSGAGLEDVETAIKKSQKAGKDFDKIASQIAAVSDPAKRAKMALDAWGKSGTKLLPMLDTLAQKSAEARALGLVPTEQSVKDADKIGDALDQIKAIGLSVFYEMGAAVAPALMPAFNIIRQIGTATVKWSRQNQGIIRMVAGIGAGLLIAGIAIATVGGGVAALGLVLGGVSATAAFLGPMFAALAGPVGIVAAIVAAVGAGLYLWVTRAESGKAALQGLLGFLSNIGETLSTTFGGIGDALMAGDLELAGKIAIKGLQVVFMEGVQALSQMFDGQLGKSISAIGTQLLSGDFAGAFQTALKQMQAWAQSFTEGLIAMFTVAGRAVTDVWKNTVNKISDLLLETSAGGGAAGTVASAVLGVDMNAEKAKGELLDRKIKANQERLGLTPTGSTDIVAEAKADARRMTEGIAKEITSQLDALDKAAQAATDRVNQELANDTAGATTALEKLKEELMDLRKTAADEAAKPEWYTASDLRKNMHDGMTEAAKQTVTVTSSAAALSQVRGSGPSIQEKAAVKTAELLAKWLDQERAQHVELKNAVRDIGVGVTA